MDLAEGLARLGERGVPLQPDVAPRLEAYLDLLEKWNRTYNLTAIRDRDRMVTHHILDALSLLPHLDAGPLRLLDVGSGAGLPGIPLAVARPAWQVTLVDSNHKKGTFMQQAVAELGLGNVTVRVARVEDLPSGAEFDRVVSRAYSDLGTFGAATRRLLAPGGKLLAMKGVMPHEELAGLPPDIRICSVERLHVPGLDGERHLVVLEAA